MKTGIIIFSTTLFLFFNNTECKAQIHKADSIRVEFQGFDTETDTDVNCEEFDDTFRDTKKKKTFYDAQSLTMFELLAKAFKRVKTQALDVRGKITFYSGKTRSKYCFTKFGCFYNDGKFYYNKKLLIYISDRIYNKHPKYLDTLRQQ